MTICEMIAIDINNCKYLNILYLRDLILSLTGIMGVGLSEFLL